METQIHKEAFDYFVDHLDTIGVVPKITLYLYTLGGETLAAWSIVNLLNQFADELEVIVPSKARSAGTLICLGADSIIMTKQATLGPIDPSINGPLNPLVEGTGKRCPVSVESINGYIEFVKSSAAGEDALEAAVGKLSDKVHPLVLGDAYRTRSQIRMLATSLLKKQLDDTGKIEAVLDFLCSDSGSHDYTIFRREASSLGLNIQVPNDDGYARIKAIYDDIAAELKLREKFEPNTLLGHNNKASYSEKRIILESVSGGSYSYVSQGEIVRGVVQLPNQPPQQIIQQIPLFEGWQHDTP